MLHGRRSADSFDGLVEAEHAARVLDDVKGPVGEDVRRRERRLYLRMLLSLGHQSDWVIKENRKKQMPSDSDTLVGMGFSAAKVARAMKATKNAGLQPAMDW